MLINVFILYLYDNNKKYLYLFELKQNYGFFGIVYKNILTRDRIEIQNPRIGFRITGVLVESKYLRVIECVY